MRIVNIFADPGAWRPYEILAFAGMTDAAGRDPDAWDLDKLDRRRRLCIVCESYPLTPQNAKPPAAHSARRAVLR
ncbi:hypothetical protein [Micropruina glycogenica]|uniref:Uncharacterized protein n=1 Tax=Micropruina glycogenica TaxID=75385 RepID=A0A2N9JMI2_9ACTN|nr:hypothetical protein [Micropruina glycogenica]SPD88793.1 protein of unknown function [Micropruina glycogenica]